MEKFDRTELRARLDKMLASRRNYRKEVQELVRQRPVVVFYGCGEVCAAVLDTWNACIGRPIDYCCDRDSTKWGKPFCGILCISPQELLAMKDRCSVFVTLGNFQPVFDFFAANRFTSVNQIFKYDLVAADFLDTCDHHEITDKLCQTYDMLGDDQSRMVFTAIVQRVLDRENAFAIMAKVCQPDQYFPPDIINLTEHERFVDVGAFTGDTVQDFAKRTRNKFDAIFCFEVDAVNFKTLQESVQHLLYADKIRIFNQGAWDCACEISYNVGKSQSVVGSGESKGRVVPLDDILGQETVTYIKMDIEGAELRALHGAQTMIRTQKPRMAVCIYHDFSHLWEIPLYLKKLVPDYRIFLRHHTNLEYEAVCYAMV